MESIKDYPNYSIDENGNVFSHNRNKYLSQCNINGYLVIGLFNKNGRKTKKIHRLVAETFISNPNNLPQINHKDGIKSNNNVNNLEWCTGKENIDHAVKTGLINSVGINNKNAKLIESDILEIRKLKGIMTLKKIAELFGVDFPTIWKIHNNYSWKHI